MFDSDLMNRARLRDESRCGPAPAPAPRPAASTRALGACALIHGPRRRNRRIRWLRAFVAISTGLQAWQLSLAAILLLLKLRGAGLSWVRAAPR